MKRSFIITLLVGGLCLLQSDGLDAAEGAKNIQEEEVDLAWELARANKLLEYNGISRSIPHFEKILAHDPYYHPDIPFVLGQIYEHKKEAARAVALYHMYLEVGDDQERIDQAKDAISKLVGKDWAKLKVHFASGIAGDIKLFGSYVVARHKESITLPLPPGDYQLAAAAEDHVSDGFNVALSSPSSEIKIQLEKKVFYGGLEVEVPGMTDFAVRIEQTTSDAPRGVAEEQRLHGPTTEPLVLPTGSYLVQIDAPNHERWVRRVKVERHGVKLVSASLTKALPLEIRNDEAYLEQRAEFDTYDAINAAKLRIDGSTKIGKLRSEQKEPPKGHGEPPWWARIK
ncbi:MAG: hypothetical protein VYE40_04525 [Myxococcota bacterium]|nr:hypothetical protein [Myxococcota bacterium]